MDIEETHFMDGSVLLLRKSLQLLYTRPSLSMKADPKLDFSD